MVFTICLYFHSLPTCIHTFVCLISEYLLVNSLELNEFWLCTYFQLQYYLEERRSDWKAFCSFELAFKYVFAHVFTPPPQPPLTKTLFSFSLPVSSSQKNLNCSSGFGDIDKQLLFIFYFFTTSSLPFFFFLINKSGNCMENYFCLCK